MNREILFKAKRKDNNEWGHGYLVIDDKNLYVNAKEDVYYIASNTDMHVEVIPETVSQFTGLTDKNGYITKKLDLRTEEYYRMNEEEV